MRNLAKHLFIMATGALCATAAVAAPVTINFDSPYSHFTNRTGGDEFYNSLTATNGGITVTARAGYWDGSGNNAGDYVVNSAGGSNTGNSYPRLGSYDTGLGVLTTSNDGDHEVDNNGSYTDFVRFYFGGADVVVKSVTVRVYDSDQALGANWIDASYNVGDTPNGTWNNQSNTGPSNDGYNTTFTLADYSANDYFFFGAGRAYNNTEFKIRSMVVDLPLVGCEPPECGEAPEPGSLALLGLGTAMMAGFAGLRRRKAKQASA